MKRRAFLHNSLILSSLTAFPGALFASNKGLVQNDQKGKKLAPSAKKVIEGINQRKKFLLENAAGHDMTSEIILDTSKDLFSNRAITNLYMHRFVKEANKRIQHTAKWFEHPHPAGRNKQWECDFAALKLCRASYLFRNSPEFETETRESIAHFFLTQDFKSIYDSENHGFMFRMCRHLIAQLYPEKTFEAYGKTGKVLVNEDAQWIKDFLHYRARQGWGEFDSSGYYSEEWEILLTLYDYTEDKEIKRLTEMTLDLLLADMSVDSLNGMYCGAQGRIYMPQAIDHANEPTYVMQYLYFDLIPSEKIGQKSTSIDALVSNYCPKELIVELALDRPTVYENFERKHLHNMSDIKPEHPIVGSIRKYTYYTPAYVMGCVQLQDPYPEGSAKGYAFHEQHDWDLSFAASTRSRIFTHHPGNRGNEHNYWTGDIMCGCGHFFQQKTAFMCLYDIPKAESYQFIHAYIPKAEFDEVVEANGFIFVRSQDSYAALKMLGGHVWSTEGEWRNREVISKGAKNGAICEVGSKEDFGSFKKFQDLISANVISFDPKLMLLTYNSKHVGKLTMNTIRLRTLNDKQVNLDYPTFNSPYMESDWNSGLITIKKNGEKMVYDFRG